LGSWEVGKLRSCFSLREYFFYGSCDKREVEELFFDAGVIFFMEFGNRGESRRFDTI
jgi:hypothetical protein